MTITNTEAVSDERLREMLAAVPRYADGKVRSSGWVGRVPAPELEALLTELLSRRAANSAGGVEVKALDWTETVEGYWWDADFYRIEAGRDGIYTLTVFVPGSAGRNRTQGRYHSLQEAKAAAQADFNRRVLSAIVPAVEAEPVVLPERDASRPAEEQGLFRKFDIRRVDGSDAPGGKHHGCRYFVLDVDHDAHAEQALIAYAAACEATHPQLATDLRDYWCVPHPTPPVSAEVTEEIARIIDPHTFMPVDPVEGDEWTAEMVQQGRDLARSKARRILAALNGKE